MADGIYIPTIIADENFKPAVVSPRQFFYNGKKSVNRSWYFGGLDPLNPGTYLYTPYSTFPYMDHYSGSASDVIPDSNSESLLFFNEETAYGSIPTENLYTKYWETYISLLYNPKTRFIECSAVIPFAVYANLKLNDIVVFKSRHYHLRAINEYDLKSGECKLQLLGPIIADSLDNQ